MTKIISLIIIYAIAFNCSMLPGSKDDSKDNMNMFAALLVATGTSVLNFRLDSGTQKNVGCSTANLASTTETVSGSSNVTLKDARFYVYDINLVRADGSKQPFTLIPDNTYQNSYTANATTYSVGLVDFADKSNDCSAGTMEGMGFGKNTSDTNSKLTGYPVYGLFSGVEFKIGLPDALNNLQSDTQTAPLSNTGMYWNWAGGYKFMKLEFLHKGTNSSVSWHNGGSSCTGSYGSISCTYKNISTVSINKSSGNLTSSDVIALNIRELTDSTDTSAGVSCMNGPQGTMMSANANCAKMGANMGINLDGTTTTSTQRAFSIQ